VSKKRKGYGVPELPTPLAVSGFDGYIYDMHTHLDMVVDYLNDLQTELDRNGKDYIVDQLSVQEIVEKSCSVGINSFLHCACEVDSILNIGNTLKEIESANAQKLQYFAAVALHPNESVMHAAGKGGQTDLIQMAEDGLEPPDFKPRHLSYDLEQAIEVVRKIATTEDKVRIIGETGLDYFRSHANSKSVQQQSFREHIELAKQLGYGLQIHDRDAHEDVVTTLLTDSAPEITLFHSFSGDVQLTKICIEHGWYMSFSGPVTFKANQSLRQAFQYAYSVAPELLLIETDAPFLTPEPHRGRTNIPAMIVHTLRYLSTEFEIPLEHLCQTISANQKQIFESIS
jgi:TatD DNase family protein